MNKSDTGGHVPSTTDEDDATDKDTLDVLELDYQRVVNERDRIRGARAFFARQLGRYQRSRVSRFPLWPRFRTRSRARAGFGWRSACSLSWPSSACSTAGCRRI